MSYNSNGGQQALIPFSEENSLVLEDCERFRKETSDNRDGFCTIFPLINLGSSYVIGINIKVTVPRLITRGCKFGPLDEMLPVFIAYREDFALLAIEELKIEGTSVKGNYSITGQDIICLSQFNHYGNVKKYEQELGNTAMMLRMSDSIPQFSSSITIPFLMTERNPFPTDPSRDISICVKSSPIKNIISAKTRTLEEESTYFDLRCDDIVSRSLPQSLSEARVQLKIGLEYLKPKQHVDKIGMFRDMLERRELMSFSKTEKSKPNDLGVNLSVKMTTDRKIYGIMWWLETCLGNECPEIGNNTLESCDITEDPVISTTINVEGRDSVTLLKMETNKYNGQYLRSKGYHYYPLVIDSISSQRSEGVISSSVSLTCSTENVDAGKMSYYDPRSNVITERIRAVLCAKLVQHEDFIHKGKDLHINQM